MSWCLANYASTIVFWMWRLTDYVGQIILGVAVRPMMQVFVYWRPIENANGMFRWNWRPADYASIFWSLHLDDCASLLFLGIGTHTTMPVCFYVNDVWPIMQVILFVEIGFWPILEI